MGLCIALWDVTKLEDSYIFPGDGSSHTVGEICRVADDRNTRRQQSCVGG